MKEIGVIKEIDKLGRFLIPKDLRERYGFNEAVEPVTTERGILLKNPDYILLKVEKTPDDY